MSLDLHPLDEVTRFGFPHHGLATGIQLGTRRLLVDGVSFPLAFDWPFLTGDSSEPYDTHLVKVPGVPEVVLPVEEVEAEKAAGRTWQNYALLSESRLILFGKAMGGWVFVDDAGERWLVRGLPAIELSRISATQPLNLDLSFVRFGYLDEEPETPVTKTATLLDIGQSAGTEPPSAGSDPSIMQLRVGSISSDGRKAVLEIHGVYSPGMSTTIRENTAPAGFLLLELSGTGPTFSAVLSVLRTRLEVLGAFDQQRVEPKRYKLDLTWNSVATPRVIADTPGADIVATPTGVTHEEVPWSFGMVAPFIGTGWVGDTRTGRVAALIFDDANVLVEFTYDVIRRVDYVYPDFGTTSVGGSLNGWIADVSDVTTINVTGIATVEIERSSAEHLLCEVVVKRDGVPVVRGVSKVDRAIEERRTVSVEGMLRRVDGVVIGREPDPVWASDAHYSHTSVCTHDDGVGTLTWNLLPVESVNAYDLALWADFTASPLPRPYAYGATVDYGNTATNDYAGSTIALRRLSNNLFGIRLRAKAGLKPEVWRVPAIAGPQNIWVNAASSDPNAARVASYHPYTHAIFTNPNDGLVGLPFVWL